MTRQSLRQRGFVVADLVADHGVEPVDLGVEILGQRLGFLALGQGDDQFVVAR